MSFDPKNTHMGSLIKYRIEECGMDLSRISKFFNCSQEEVEEMFLWKSFDTALLLKFSILLKYDFFRVYSQYLILYAPPGSTNYNAVSIKKSPLPRFRKNIYTKEIIDFILEQIISGNKTKKQVIEEYRIPKATLYKWLIKYK
ncbi:transposase [Chryseobacterium sp. T16E-39]|nr:transposase [Chryseobacterium sp. T16E-39]